MIKFKHLWAWDRMMGSTLGWSWMLQEMAERENAPIDAIYRQSKGRYAVVTSIANEDLRQRIEEAAAKLEDGPTHCRICGSELLCGSIAGMFCPKCTDCTDGE